MAARGARAAVGPDSAELQASASIEIQGIGDSYANNTEPRRFLAALSSAGAASLIGPGNSFAAEAPPETTTVRFPKYSQSICGAPLVIIDELLRAEGFTDVRYVPTTGGATGIRLAARGEVDFENAFVGTHIALIDAGSGRPAHRLLRTVCPWGHPQHP
jgi:ABC-type nitrate/sulfonate/bicarbonate transport system substrate-binding protein